MTDSTIRLQDAPNNDADGQVKEIKIVLNTMHEGTNTNIRIGEDESEAKTNPPVKMLISNMKTTKFHSLTDWISELKDSPKIWLNYEAACFL